MDHSTWFSSSLDLKISSNSTLQLFDNSPVRDIDKEQLSSMISIKDDSHQEATVMLEEELSRLSAENKRLTEMLVMACDKYNALRTQMVDYMANTGNNREENNCIEIHNSSASSPSKKRKSGDISSSEEEQDSCAKKSKGETIIGVTKISKAYVKIKASDTSLIVKDEYQWRKYGQKVTRDNPCPRAYFRCSFAPKCPVKKKVQRSLEDQSILVATYEGEHNHPPPSQSQPPAANRLVVSSASLSSSSGQATVTLDLTKPKPLPTATTSRISSQHRIDSYPPEFQKFLAEMASSLTKDPSFTTSLAAAISGKFMQHNLEDKL